MAILSQKLALIDALLHKYDTKVAGEMFRSICPIVGASIGQHFRHSLDHLEIAASAATDGTISKIHYDLRARGGASESDMNEASNRIAKLSDTLETLCQDYTFEVDSPNNAPEEMIHGSRSVMANFMLTGDGVEEELTSTIGRELGFAAHHAIHHMALIKIIALNHAELTMDDLPADFGRAPSTVNHDRTLR